MIASQHKGVSQRCAGSQRLSRPARVSRVCKAVEGQYNHIVPNFDYINAVLDAFPEDAVANPDEARALYSHGDFVILDIRNNIEVEKYGKMPNDRTSAGSVCIPFKLAKKRFEDGQVKLTEEDNPYFLEDVEFEFPDKSSKLIVMDFDGHSCAMDALELLYEAGYEEIVGLQGGYKAWFKTWDNKLKRRNMGEYQEHSWGDGETSCGIHASGAGFANQDAQSADFWKDF